MSSSTRPDTIRSSFAPSTGPASAPTRRDPGRRDVRFWIYLGVAATCAVLIPVVAVVGGRLTSDGPVRVALIWAIALLMGSAVYASAAATNAVRRVR